jgi:phosphoribosylanthranilate isomerase
MSVRIKICGITTPGAAQTAASLGADAIGLNFYAKSPRYVTEAQAWEILDALPPFVEPVGLYVNERLPDIQAKAQDFGIRIVQIHGDHDELPISGPVRFVPAFSLGDATSIERLNSYLSALRTHGDVPVPPAILIDGQVAGMYGGTGKTAPWELLNALLHDYRRVNDFIEGVRIILAGGLTPDNVAEAIRVVRPYAVDVASGVESAPGRKDAEKMRRFIENARRA